MVTTLHFTVATDTFIRVLILGFLSFLISMLITPIYTTLAYKGEWWKKPRTKTVTGEAAKVFTALHADKHKRHIPTMAGIIVVVAVSIVTIVLNWSRSETWLPVAAFVGAGAVGLLDDIINIRGDGSGVAGLPSKLKFLLITLVALAGGFFFYYKLGVSSIHVPLLHSMWHIGWLIIPLFVLVVVATANAVNMSDGLDGLAGGLTATAFGVYTIIALIEQKYGVAGFCMTMVGSLLSYTWFNIFPARFFMVMSALLHLGRRLASWRCSPTQCYFCQSLVSFLWRKPARSFCKLLPKNCATARKSLKFRRFIIILRQAAGLKQKLRCASG